MKADMRNSASWLKRIEEAELYATFEARPYVFPNFELVQKITKISWNYLFKPCDLPRGFPAPEFGTILLKKLELTCKS